MYLKYTKNIFAIISKKRQKQRNNKRMKYYCIKQHDITDCGAACLATICRQNGYKIGINGVSMDSSVFQYGLSFEQEIT